MLCQRERIENEGFKFDRVRLFGFYKLAVSVDVRNFLVSAVPRHIEPAVLCEFLDESAADHVDCGASCEECKSAVGILAVPASSAGMSLYSMIWSLPAETQKLPSFS